MSNRLNQEREKLLQPKRMQIAIDKITEKGIEINVISDREIQFEYDGATIYFFPYSGWHSGKSIKDGRGLKNLLNQLY